MKRLVKFVDHYGLLALLLIVVALTLVAFYQHWAEPQQLQSLSGFAVSVLLAAVTWQYVRTTQKTLELYREQWEFQQKVGIKFGMSIRDGKPWIRVVNPGGIHFMVTKAVFLKKNQPPHTMNTYLMVGPGERHGFFVPLRVYENEAHNCDVNVTLHYEHYGQPEETISRAFRIEFSRGKIFGIKRGVRGGWFVPCPKCGNQMAAVMITTGLENFEQASAREAVTKEQLSVTCPNHQSPWMNTVDQINERNKAEQESGTEE
jgi:hypothetical protein